MRHRYTESLVLLWMKCRIFKHFLFAVQATLGDFDSRPLTMVGPFLRLSPGPIKALSVGDRLLGDKIKPVATVQSTALQANKFTSVGTLLSKDNALRRCVVWMFTCRQVKAHFVIRRFIICIVKFQSSSRQFSCRVSQMHTLVLNVGIYSPTTPTGISVLN